MNVGLHDGLITEDHHSKMGSAIWLYIWCLRRQTKRNGLIYGGAPITYEKIVEQTKYKRRTIEGWMRRLISGGYIEVHHLAWKALKIRVLKAQKFGPKQLELNPQRAADTHPQKQADIGAKVSGFNKRKSMRYRNSETPPNPQSVPADLGISLDAWATFKKLRVALGRPIVEGSEHLTFARLYELQAMGNTPEEVLQQAIRDGSYTLYPIRKVNGNERESFQERRNRKSTEAIIEGIFGGLGNPPQEVRGHFSPAPDADSGRLLQGNARLIDAAPVGCSLPASNGNLRILSGASNNSEGTRRTPEPAR